MKRNPKSVRKPRQMRLATALAVMKDVMPPSLFRRLLQSAKLRRELAIEAAEQKKVDESFAEMRDDPDYWPNKRRKP